MRTYSTRNGRPAAVSVTVPIGTIRVEVREPAGPGELEPIAASVSLAPQVAGDEAAEQAIADATIIEEAGMLTVSVPYRLAGFGGGIARNFVVQVLSGAVEAV